MFLSLPLLGIIGMQEIIVIGLVVLLLFGGKKIPELMRGLGAGVKSFKEGMKEGESAPEQKTQAPEQKEGQDGQA